MKPELMVWLALGAAAVWLWMRQSAGVPAPAATKLPFSTTMPLPMPPPSTQPVFVGAPVGGGGSNWRGYTPPVWLKGRHI